MVWSADSVDQSANSAKKPPVVSGFGRPRGAVAGAGLLACWGTWVLGSLLSTFLFFSFQRGIYYRERLRAYVGCQASSHMFFAFVVY